MTLGKIRVKLISADISALINRAKARGIQLWDVVWVDGLTLKLWLSVTGYNRLCSLIRQTGDQMEVLGRSGLYWGLYGMFRRPVLWLTSIVLLVMTFCLPGRVLFITVEGNSKVSTLEILQAAEECGLRFGAKRRDVRSEKVKNQLLNRLPQLHWTGVNTTGCTAVISVREEVSKPQADSSSGSNIVAARDGILLSVTVTSGQSLCAVGQVVKAGQLMVSGRHTSGLLTTLTRSQAEIIAQTSRQLTVVSPLCTAYKEQQAEGTRIFSLLIGKKRINLSNGSGISYTTCDKIYEEYYMTLPGGFILPVALCVETLTPYLKKPAAPDTSSVTAMMLEQADAYLLSKTVSGRILHRNLQVASDDTKHTISVSYICSEEIGMEQIGESIFDHGENH